MTKAWHNRRGFLICLLILVLFRTATSQEKDFHAYPENVAKYLKRIYDQKQQPLAFREDYTGGFAKWQQDARAALQEKIGLPRIIASVGEHQPVVQLDAAEDHGEYWRQKV